jgi:hypothetical protein
MHFLVVYDPDVGFVTGGGWIDSPESAYMPDPSLTGRANFGTEIEDSAEETEVQEHL